MSSGQKKFCWMPDLTSEGRPFSERSLLPRGLPCVLPANIRHSRPIPCLAKSRCTKKARIRAASTPNYSSVTLRDSVRSVCEKLRIYPELMSCSKSGMSATIAARMVIVMILTALNRKLTAMKIVF